MLSPQVISDAKKTIYKRRMPIFYKKKLVSDGKQKTIYKRRYKISFGNGLKLNNSV